MFVGQLGSGIVNVILKRIIKEERPKRMEIPSLSDLHKEAFRSHFCTYRDAW